MVDKANKIMLTADRILALEPLDLNKSTLTNTGLVDNRLFTGENRLHAIMDVQTSLWSMRYDAGIVPQPLQQRFTSYGRLKKHAEEYFKKRNIRVKEVD